MHPRQRMNSGTEGNADFRGSLQSREQNEEFSVSSVCRRRQMHFGGRSRKGRTRAKPQWGVAKWMRNRRKDSIDSRWEESAAAAFVVGSCGVVHIRASEGSVS